MTDMPAQTAGDGPVGHETRRPSASPWLAYLDLTAPGVAVLMLALLLLVGQLPVFIFPTFTPRMALVLLVAPVGLLILVGLGVRRDRAAIPALATCGWILIAGLFSGAPLLAFKGTVGKELSGVIVIAVLGVWALGRVAANRVRALLPSVILFGLVVNGVIAMTQVAFDIRRGHLALLFDRATGLTSNPVFLGALMAGGAALVAAWPNASLQTRVVGVMFFGAAVDLSGSRVAVIAGLAAITLSAVTALDPVPFWRRGVLSFSFIAGIGVSSLLATLAQSRSSVDRVTSGGTGGRLTAWRYGSEALLERPVFGWGFGRFRAATQGRFSASFVRDHASDDLHQAWFDAHNLVVTIAVASGVVGLVFMAWFVREAVRTAGGPLAMFALALGLTWLLQPAGLATLPIGLLALGASATCSPTVDLPIRQTIEVLAAGAVAFGVAAAGWLVASDLNLKSSVDSRDARQVERAAGWFPGDAVVADLVAQAWFIQQSDTPERRAKVLEWSELSVERESDRPYLWSRHGGRLLALGAFEDARLAIEESLELEPWHLQSWQVMYLLAAETDDASLTATATERLCMLGQSIEQCVP